MSWRLRHKITGLAIVSALVPVVALALLVFFQEKQSSRIIEEKIEDIIRQNLEQVLRDVYGLCQTTNDLVQMHVNNNLNVARRIFVDAGPVSFGPETVDWVAVNQETRADRTVTLPKMYLGGTWLGQNESFAIPSLVVDEVASLVGGTVTIFQRMNEEGDMLRVTTNVPLPDGRRALGTYIPAVQANGTPNPVVQTVLKGETYYGSAVVVSEWCLTAYEPIKDENDEVVGILYVGVPREKVESLREAIHSTEVGRNGYLWIMYGKDIRRRDSFVLVQQDRFPGESKRINSLLDAQGRPYYEEIQEAALRLPVGAIGKWDPVVPAAGGGTEELDVYFTYFPEWDWVIGLTVPDADFDEPRYEVKRAFKHILNWTLLGGVAMLIVVGGCALYLGGLIANPIAYLVRIAREVAEGDLTEASQLMEKGQQNNTANCATAAKAKDETGQLFRAMSVMIRNLRELVGKVKQSGDHLVGTAGEITHFAEIQEGTVHDFGTSTNEIAAAVKEISATAQELAETMVNVSDAAQRTARSAGAGREQLDGMRSSVDELAGATRSISGKLTLIAEKAQNINNVVTAISKVADQTNLLSLNAAIEAEKAGEYGLGFAVVAREIRRLADQTAEATLDIEQMVKEMQSSVHAGVMEMDKFHESVRKNVDEVSNLATRMEQIIAEVEALTPRFDAVKEGMQSQSVGANQITEAVVALNAAANQTHESLLGFRNATLRLEEAVHNLENGIANFKCEEGITSEKDNTERKSDELS